jgi:hypothetical protein
MGCGLHQISREKHMPVAVFVVIPVPCPELTRKNARQNEAIDVIEMRAEGKIAKLIL